MPHSRKIRYVGDQASINAGAVVYSNTNLTTSGKYASANGSSIVDLGKYPALTNLITGTLYGASVQATSPGTQYGYVIQYTKRDSMEMVMMGCPVSTFVEQGYWGTAFHVSTDAGETWTQKTGPSKSDFKTWGGRGTAANDSAWIRHADVMWCPISNKYVFFVTLLTHRYSDAASFTITLSISCDINWTNWAKVGDSNIQETSEWNNRLPCRAFRTLAGNALLCDGENVRGITAGSRIDISPASWPGKRTGADRLFMRPDGAEFIAVTSSNYYTSSDGDTWTIRSRPGGNDISSAIYGPLGWLLVVWGAASYTTTNHVTFTIQPGTDVFTNRGGLPAGGSGMYLSQHTTQAGPYSGRYFLAISKWYDGVSRNFSWVLHSADLVNWTLIPRPSNSQLVHLTTFVSNNDASKVFVAVGPTGFGGQPTEYILKGPTGTIPAIPAFQGKSAYMKLL